MEATIAKVPTFADLQLPDGLELSTFASIQEGKRKAHRGPVNTWPTPADDNDHHQSQVSLPDVQTGSVPALSPTARHKLTVELSSAPPPWNTSQSFRSATVTSSSSTLPHTPLSKEDEKPDTRPSLKRKLPSKSDSIEVCESDDDYSVLYEVPHVGRQGKRFRTTVVSETDEE